MNYTVVPASVLHIKPIVEDVRQDTTITNARTALRHKFMASHYSRTALIDGRPVAMWGIMGMALSDEGEVWLALNKQAQKLPIAVVKEARKELAAMGEGMDHLYAKVNANDPQAIAYARTLGFLDSFNGEDAEGRITMTFLPKRHIVEMPTAQILAFA